jgi:hypothetical protein
MVVPGKVVLGGEHLVSISTRDPFFMLPVPLKDLYAVAPSSACSCRHKANMHACSEWQWCLMESVQLTSNTHTSDSFVLCMRMAVMCCALPVSNCSVST